MQRTESRVSLRQIMCSEIIACHSLSDSLWHCASVIEMSRDHNVTAKESIRHELFRLCTFRAECLRGEADGWRSHGPGWKGLYGGDCGLNLEWAHTYSGRLKSVCYFCVCAREDLRGAEKRRRIVIDKACGESFQRTREGMYVNAVLHQTLLAIRNNF